MAVLSHLVKYGARLRLVALSGFLLTQPAQALPPEHEMRRLMLAVEEAVSSDNWTEAGEYLNRIQQMEGEKPADYYFYRGQAMFRAGLFNEARVALETYVTRAGSEGSHYQQALSLITDIERARRSAGAQGTGAEPPPRIAVIEPAEDHDLSVLRRLYLADSDREALVLHLNSLLELSGWRADTAVVRLDQPADLFYQVSVEGGVIRFQELRREGQNRHARQSEPLEVYGVNPRVEWNCEAATASCWIYDPRDGSRLLQLGYNRDRAAEVARTLGQLIRALQNPGSN